MPNYIAKTYEFGERVQTSVMVPWSCSGVLTVRVGGHSFHVEEDYTILGVRATVGTAPTGTSIIVDVNKAASTLFTTQANRPTIAAGSQTSGVVVPDVTTISAGQALSVDIDQVGSTEPGRNLTVTVRLARA